MNPADVPGRHKKRGRHFGTERSETADPRAALQSSQPLYPRRTQSTSTGIEQGVEPPEGQLPSYSSTDEQPLSICTKYNGRPRPEARFAQKLMIQDPTVATYEARMSKGKIRPQGLALPHEPTTYDQDSQRNEDGS